LGDVILSVMVRLCYSGVPVKAEKMVLEVLRSGQWSPGPKVREFEEKFGRLHKAKYAVFVNSGTDALRIGLLALKEKFGWDEGDYVAVPSVTFVATVNVVLQAGLTPFFVDVGMHDFCINPSNLERRLSTGQSKRIRAVMPVHLFGKQADMPELLELARKYDLRVLEDSCETILNPIQGHISCHSTYMAHHLTTGVGGFALTNDPELNLIMRSYANHGRNIDYLPGYTSKVLSKKIVQHRFRFDRNGYSCRGTEFEAALGLSQLDLLKSNVEARRSVALKLSDALDGLNGFHLTVDAPGHTWFAFPVVLSEYSKYSRDSVCLKLELAGIETRFAMPITNQPCFTTLTRGSSFTVADWLNTNGFYIPCHPGVTDKNVQTIKKAFESIFRRSK
jgi:dTDP-4-amino-4,6-dideoxygalactose transaminase